MTRKREGVVSQEAFDAFLACLDPDRTRAGEKYETLRHKLITFFENRDCAQAEDLADATIDRVIRKHQEVKIKKLMSYTLGVARRVASEVYRQPRWESLHNDTPNRRPPDDSREQERRWNCLDEGMRRLAPEDRDLILEYYRHEKGLKIQRRRKIARLLGTNANALRISAFRIRRQLAGWVKECMKIQAEK